MKIAGTALAAAALMLPLAGIAYADPEEDPKPVAQIPDPQGPGCDAFKTAVPDWKDFANQQVGTVLASIPEISTFNRLISGQANPAVNIVPMLNNGPYVVFAPSDDAFAAMDQAKLASITADPAALTRLEYYHVFLGVLRPDDLAGQRPSQDGAQVKVTGKGGDLVFNDTAKSVCGGIPAFNAQVYIIDTVLDPDQAPPPIGVRPSEQTAPAEDDATAEQPAGEDAQDSGENPAGEEAPTEQ